MLHVSTNINKVGVESIFGFGRHPRAWSRLSLSYPTWAIHLRWAPNLFGLFFNGKVLHVFIFFYKTSNASHWLSLLSALFALVHRLLRKNIINVLNSPTCFKFVCAEIFEISLRLRYRTPKTSLTLRLRLKEIFWPDSYDVQVSNPIKYLIIDLNSSKGISCI